VILVDLGLPDMHGTAVAKRLGEAERTTRIPILALTSLPLEGGDWFRAAGFAGYVEKPFDVGEFPDRVRGYCTER
jgi:CheY-like chemotaxis protein